MKELSLNILDITENSVKAGASLTEIIIDETADVLTLTIKDNGCGMSEEAERSVTWRSSFKARCRAVRRHAQN